MFDLDTLATARAMFASDKRARRLAAANRTRARAAARREKSARLFLSLAFGA